jgi:hypothetical protein
MNIEKLLCDESGCSDIMNQGWTWRPLPEMGGDSLWTLNDILSIEKEGMFTVMENQEESLKSVDGWLDQTPDTPCDSSPCDSPMGLIDLQVLNESDTPQVFTILFPYQPHD